MLRKRNILGVWLLGEFGATQLKMRPRKSRNCQKRGTAIWAKKEKQTRKPTPNTASAASELLHLHLRLRLDPAVISPIYTTTDLTLLCFFFKLILFIMLCGPNFPRGGGRCRFK